ncbi:unnamed protein product [Periconia digitata]|uniref:BZIP domain-containing protein n=1 Tax=Periconia digitata TaxID=1303443 RepID=A0A9W4XF55_9PLEO|nr:unnamed protein product [Periconia digitata]
MDTNFTMDPNYTMDTMATTDTKDTTNTLDIDDFYSFLEKNAGMDLVIDPQLSQQDEQQVEQQVEQQAGPNVGPMSKEFKLPELPKPGRKPAKDEGTKRQRQNRASQKRHRDKKREAVQELTEKYQQEREYGELVREAAHVKINRLQAELDTKIQKIALLEQKNGELRDQINQLLPPPPPPEPEPSVFDFMQWEQR